MKQCKYVFSILLLCFGISFSQEPPGAKQIALSHADISASDDVFSIFNNPAGMSLINYRQIGFFYSPAPYGVKELSYAYAAYSEPFSFGSLSGGFSIYGYELYKETNFAIGFGRMIAPNFYLGLTAAYRNISIKNYGSKGVLFINAGTIFKLTNQIGLGISLENITRSKISNDSNDIPTVFWFGLDLNLVKDFIFYTAIKKELNYNPSLRLGVEYSILDFLKLRIGAGSDPNNYSSGIGILYQFLQADYSISSHADLGVTHQFGLIIFLK
jgi:hypothetical protein